MDFEPNKYQKAIFEHVKNNRGHLVVEANAGTGKTATNIEIVKMLPPGKSILVLAFNKHIEVEMSKKLLGTNAMSKTMHSLGLGCISRFTKNFPKIDDNKMKNIFLKVVKNQEVPKEYIKDLMGVVLKLTDLFRSTLLLPSIENLELLMDRHSITTSCDLDNIVNIIKDMLIEDVRMLSIIDFEDMIYLPVKLMMPFYKNDYVLADEIQDFNPAQLRMLLMSVKPKTGMVVAVGDRFQSIYGFRSADIEAMDKIINALNATVLPLSVCYRCPALHVLLAQQYVPTIEVSPNAKEGVVTNITVDEMLDVIDTGDLVICRNNAPLIKPAFQLLKSGVKVVIKGHDIGEGLLTLIKKINASSLEELEERLGVWKDNEVARLEKKDKNIDAIMDKYDCIMIFMEDVRSVEELKKHIKNIFSNDSGEITFSSIHRAKGTESDNVFIINFGLMPSPYAKKSWEKDQERNCQYVASTRSKSALYFVD